MYDLKKGIEGDINKEISASETIIEEENGRISNLGDRVDDQMSLDRNRDEEIEKNVVKNKESNGRENTFENAANVPNFVEDNVESQKTNTKLASDKNVENENYFDETIKGSPTATIKDIFTPSIDMPKYDPKKHVGFHESDETITSKFQQGSGGSRVIISITGSSIKRKIFVETEDQTVPEALLLQNIVNTSYRSDANIIRIINLAKKMFQDKNTSWRIKQEYKNISHGIEAGILKSLLENDNHKDDLKFYWSSTEIVHLLKVILSIGHRFKEKNGKYWDIYHILEMESIRSYAAHLLFKDMKKSLTKARLNLKNSQKAIIQRRRNLKKINGQFSFNKANGLPKSTKRTNLPNIYYNDEQFNTIYQHCLKTIGKINLDMDILRKYRIYNKKQVEYAFESWVKTRGEMDLPRNYVIVKYPKFVKKKTFEKTNKETKIMSANPKVDVDIDLLNLKDSSASAVKAIPFKLRSN